MNCFFCHQHFSQQRIPRVLIDCGHTVCQPCLVNHHSNNSISCPECKQLNFGSIQQFPKNLTLLNLQQTTNGCSIHHKPYQGFCEKDKQLLCVTCILDDKHRTHKVSSIQQTVTQDKQILTASSQKIKSSINDLRNTGSKIKESIQNSSVAFGTLYRQIESFYNKIRMTLDSKQQQCKAKVQNIYNNYLNKLQNSQRQVQQKIQFLIDLFKMYQDISLLKNIDYLNEANKRIFILENSKTKPFKVDLQLPILSFNKGDQIRKIQVYLQQLMESEPKKAQSRIKKTISTTHRQQSAKCDKKDGVVVLQLDLNDKYRKHQESKNKMFKKNIQTSKFCTWEPQQRSLSEIKMKSSQVSNRSVEEIFRKDVTLSIKDYEYSIREYEQKIYHFGGVNTTRSEIFDCNSMESSLVGFMLERTRFQAISLSQNQILILGGSRMDNTIIFDINKLSSTSLQFKLQPSRLGFSAVILNDQMIVLGGSDGKSTMNSVESYNLKNLLDGEKKLQGLVFSRTDFSAVVGYDGKIYVAGGIGSKQTTLLSSQRYDFSKNRWQILSNMNVARSHFGLASLPDGIYAIGGSDGSNALSSVQKFDYVSQTWKVVANMNETRLNHSVCTTSDGEGILVFGGHNSTVLKSIQYYSIINQKWSNIGNMMQERYMHQSVLIKSSH